MIDSSGNFLISPFWQVFFGIALLCAAIFLASARKPDSSRQMAATANWIRKYYIWVLIGVTATYFAWAGATYLWQIPGLVSKTLEMLNIAFAEKDADNIRHLTYAFAAMIGALAILPTVPFQLIKAWINERTANNAEQGHITDRINKAVEGLGASKTVTFQRKDAKGNLTYEKGADGKPDYAKPVIVTETQPNLEVRIGAIFALERISQDSLRDHVQIMEILTAYIRENAKITGRPHNVWVKWRDAVNRIDKFPPDNAINQWLSSLPNPRIDIQAAMSVIGRRGELQKERESYDKRHNYDGYKIDLNSCDLRKIDLRNLDFTYATFQGSRLEGAKLYKTKLKHANLISVHLESANLVLAKLGKAVFSESFLSSADLTGAEVEGTIFSRTHFEKARLVSLNSFYAANFIKSRIEGARLQNVTLSFNFIALNQLDGSFGDGSVTMPEKTEWPTQ